MAGRYLGRAICFLTLFSPSIIGLAAERKSLLEIPEGYSGIVAYGSLISLPSMEQTLGRKYSGPVREVHLRGYGREWVCVRPFNDAQAIAAGAGKVAVYLLRGTERVPVMGAAELNIFPAKKGRINGLLYLITEEELLSLDKRERGYRRVDVTGSIEEFRFRGGKVYAYEGPPGSPSSASGDQGAYVLIKEFLELVTGACDQRGKGFRAEFDESTRPCSFPVVSHKDLVREKSK